MAYASFSAMVYEIVGPAGSAAATLYSVFPAAGNQAIAYTLLSDGAAQHAWKTRGTLWTDAAMNAGGVIVLLLLVRTVFPERLTDPTAPSGADSETGALDIGSATEAT
jgi:hypothetical protein